MDFVDSIMSLGSGLIGGLAQTGLNMWQSAYQTKLNKSAAGYNVYLGEYLMDKQREMNLGLVHDTPSAYMSGLKEAGVNPMLVISSGIPNAPTVSSAQGSMVAPSAPNLSGVVNTALQASKAVSDVRQANADAKIAEGDAKSADAESKARIEQAKADSAEAKLDREKSKLELDALNDDDGITSWSSDGGKTFKDTTRHSYRQMIRNDIERRRYTNSREHAIAEDTVNAIHGGSSAYQSFTAARANRARERGHNRVLKFLR